MDNSEMQIVWKLYLDFPYTKKNEDIDEKWKYS